jgi:hypothetical protein
MAFELATSSDRVVETTSIDPFKGTCIAGSCALSSVARYINVGRSVREQHVFIVSIHTL